MQNVYLSLSKDFVISVTSICLNDGGRDSNQVFEKSIDKFVSKRSPMRPNCSCCLDAYICHILTDINRSSTGSLTWPVVNTGTLWQGDARETMLNIGDTRCHMNGSGRFRRGWALNCMDAVKVVNDKNNEVLIFCCFLNFVCC